MQNWNQIIKQNIEESEIVLVGIGKAFEVDKADYKNEKYFKDYYKKYKVEYGTECEWIAEFLEGYYSKTLENDRLLKAYRGLKNSLTDKEYFILTLNTNLVFENAVFDQESFVAPCGNIHKLQCEHACNSNLYEAKEYEENIINDLKKDDLALIDIKKPVCPICGADLVYHTIKAEDYIEAEYLPKWERYTKWLQRTLNKKLCILELGVNFEYPGVIRFPFEKVAYINDKAKFIRMNLKFSQLTEEIKAKSISIPLEPADFFREWNCLI